MKRTFGLAGIVLAAALVVPACGPANVIPIGDACQVESPNVSLSSDAHILGRVVVTCNGPGRSFRMSAFLEFAGLRGEKFRIVYGTTQRVTTWPLVGKPTTIPLVAQCVPGKWRVAWESTLVFTNMDRHVNSGTGTYVKFRSCTARAKDLTPAEQKQLAHDRYERKKAAQRRRSQSGG